MQYNININQLAIYSNYGTQLDNKDCFLISFFAQVHLAKSGLERIVHEEDIYIWLTKSKILEEIPLLNIKARQLNYRLEKLESLGLIKRHVVGNHKAYYALGEDFYKTQQVVEKDVEKQVENSPCSGGGMQSSVGGVCNPTTEGGMQFETPNNNTNNNLTNNNIYSSVEGDPSTTGFVDKKGLGEKASRVIEEINKVGGRNFRVSKTSTKEIFARLKSGEPEKVLIGVVRLKGYDDFFKKENYKFLNPKTLFNATNFEKYREELVTNLGGPEGFQVWLEHGYEGEHGHNAWEFKQQFKEQ